MCDVKVVLNPGDEVVFESSLNELMKKVWGNQFMDVCSWEVIREWLKDEVQSG